MAEVTDLQPCDAVGYGKYELSQELFPRKLEIYT